MVDVTKPLFTQETSVFRMRCTLCIEIGTISSLAYHRAEWKPEPSSSLLHTLRDGNRSAYFSFPCFTLIIIPILVTNAIICDTEPGPHLHPGFERCQLLFQSSEVFFKHQEPKAKSRDSKWSGIKGSVSEKSWLLWNGNQNNQRAQRGRRCLLLELPRKNQ